MKKVTFSLLTTIILIFYAQQVALGATDTMEVMETSESAQSTPSIKSSIEGYTYSELVNKVKEYETIRTKYFETKRLCPSNTGESCTPEEYQARVDKGKELLLKKIETFDYLFRSTFNELVAIRGEELIFLNVKPENLSTFDVDLEELKTQVNSAENIPQLVEISSNINKFINSVYSTFKPDIGEILANKYESLYNGFPQIDSAIEEQQRIAARFGNQTEDVMQSRMDYDKAHRDALLGLNQKDYLFSNYYIDPTSKYYRAETGFDNLKNGIQAMTDSINALKNAVDKLNILYKRNPWN